MPAWERRVRLAEVLVQAQQSRPVRWVGSGRSPTRARWHPLAQGCIWPARLALAPPLAPSALALQAAPASLRVGSVPAQAPSLASWWDRAQKSAPGAPGPRGSRLARRLQPRLLARARVRAPQAHAPPRMVPPTNPG